tara:strand:+ start:333 stop:497 length:165 start_codon:yes stop_codon:yes gene_type:complete
LWKLKGCKKQTRSENKYAIDETLDQPCNKFIIPAKKNKTDPKAYSHENRQQVDI